jgi:soluble lytic murein transglycosylase
MILVCSLLMAPLHATATPAAAADPYAAGRAAFISARAAVSSLPTEPADGDPAALRQYPLYPYLVAARLSRQLALALPAAAATSRSSLPIDDTIAAFLAQEGERPAARQLRRDWLRSLADRRLWSRFLDEYSADRDGQVALRCASFAARIALDRTDGLQDAIAATWLAPKSLPDDCDAAFAWWSARGGQTTDLTSRRARLALEQGESGLARFLARSLPAELSGPVLQWAALIERPGPEIASLIAAPDRPVENAALLDGWMRYARGNAEAAADLYPRLVEARRLDARSASPFAMWVALAQSWSRLPRALDFFQKMHPDDFDERAHEWHVRAALWAGDWPRVLAATAAMPEALRNQNRWRYWFARASEQVGNDAEARAAYAAVVPTDNWYAVHSAARLGTKFAPSLQPLLLNDAEITLLAGEPGFVRTSELRLVAMDAEAAAEWRAAFDELTPARQLQAIGLAARWGWHMQAIATAARQGFFNDYELLYPRPFDYDVEAAARRTGLDIELIYAVIRQESLYQPAAGSSAGAVGLMQLLPETARITARRAGMPQPTRAQLLQPAINVPLGSHYLAGLIARFGGETALATAGYNAGPNAVRRWLPGKSMDLDVWVENIPFNETRGYVQRVAWHALVFRWLNDRKPRDVSSWQEKKVGGEAMQAAAAAD